MIKTESLDIRICHTFASRAKGLLRQHPINPRAAVWLAPCRAVHTFGMREPLSVLMINASREPLEWVSPAKPNRIYGRVSAASVIEMAYRCPKELEKIHQELLHVLSRLDKAEDFLVGRVKTRIQDAAD